MTRLRNALLPTKGQLVAGAGQVCIVSFPASLGQKAWNGMVGGGRLNFACVWTGDNNSPASEWFDPWVLNVDEAVKRGMTLLVYGHSDHPEENQFKHVSPLWGEQKYRLGGGQQAEVKHMNEKGVQYKVFEKGIQYKVFPKLSRRLSPGPRVLRAPRRRTGRADGSQGSHQRRPARTLPAQALHHGRAGCRRACCRRACCRRAYC